MATRVFCLVAGSLYFLLGILGFNEPLVRAAPPRAGWENMLVNDYYGELFGMFPVNGVVNVLSILLGGLGALCATSLSLSRAYCRFLFGLMLLMTLIGLAPGRASSLWGIAPMSGFNILFHAATAVLAWYFGMIYPLEAERERAGALAA